jgi:hypothetical protein
MIMSGERGYRELQAELLTMYIMVECRAAVYGGCVEEGELTEVIIGTGILRPQILDPGLGRPEVHFSDPGWSSELYITKVEVFK